ncbi:MAG: Ig-like domain-containing protein, partial [Bdellovibrionales bacterium]|nr:Ig-like domain-containing protein [Bdellovibrionales bacterium]
GLGSEPSVVFQADPQSSYECTSCSVYEKTTSDEVVIDSEQVDINNDFNAGSLALSLPAYIIEVTVKDGNGNPISGADVSGYSESDFSKYGYGTTGNDGIARFAGAEGKYFISTYSPNREFSDAFEDIEITTQGVTKVTLTVALLDSSITVNLKDGNGVPYVVPTANEFSYASVFCSESVPNFGMVANPAYGFIDIPAGNSAAQVPVAGDRSYDCYVNLSGAAASSFHVEVGKGQNKTADSIVTVADHELMVTFTQNGSPVSMNAIVYAFINNEYDENGNSSGPEHFADALTPNQDGSYTLMLVPDQSYLVSVFQIDEQSQISGNVYVNSSTNYILEKQHTEHQTTGASSSLAIPVKEADMTITGQVLKGSTPLQYAWVDLFCGEDDFDSETGLPVGDFFFTGTSTDGNGMYSLPGLSGFECVQNVWIPYDQSDSNTLNPAPKEFVGTAGTLTHNFVAVEADLRLAVTLQSPESSSSSFAWGYCNFASLLTSNFVSFNDLGDFSQLQTESVGLLSGAKYFVHCEAYESSNFYFLDTTYDARNVEPGEDSVTFALTSGGTHWPQESKTISLTSATTVTLADGLSTVEFPKGFISDNDRGSETTATFVAGTSKRHLGATQIAKPYKPWDFTLTVGNQPFTGDFASPVTLTLFYAESEFPAGTNLSALNSCVGSAKGNSTALQSVDCSVELVTIEGVTYVKFVITANHFSNFGLNFAKLSNTDTDTGPTDIAPTKVTVKKAKPKSRAKGKKSKSQVAKLSWATVSNATSYLVKITRTNGDEETSEMKTVNAKKKGKSQSKTFKLSAKKPGTYRFSVAAVVEGVTSAYTSGSKTVVVKAAKKKKK